MATTTKIAAPKTATEAQAMLQDAVDVRDALDRRFSAGDPPPAAEWTAALARVEYGRLAVDGLVVREQGEAIVAARAGALSVRKRFRTALAKQLAGVIRAEDEFTEAARVLLEAVAAHNGQVTSFSQEVRALRPAHIPPDAEADYLKNALRFGGSTPPPINASSLMQGVVHNALQSAYKSLSGRDQEFLRSLEGPALAESQSVRNLSLALAEKQ